MNKIIYISIGAIWLLLVSIVVVGVLVAPDLDKVGSLQKYKAIGQQYLDHEPVNVEAIKINTPDDKFLRAYAKYLLAFQKSENDYGGQQALFKISLEPQNLDSMEQINNAYQKLANLAKQTQASYDILLTAQKETIKSFQDLKDENLELYNDSLEGAIKVIETEEIQFRDDVTKYRLAIEKYYKAILDFLIMKQGAYTVQGGALVFMVPEDQQYYDQLKQGQKTYEQELAKAFDDYQQQIRKTNSDIPVDIK